MGAGLVGRHCCGDWRLREHVLPAPDGAAAGGPIRVDGAVGDVAGPDRHSDTLGRRHRQRARRKPAVSCLSADQVGSQRRTEYKHTDSRHLLAIINLVAIGLYVCAIIYNIVACQSSTTYQCRLCHAQWHIYYKKLDFTLNDAVSQPMKRGDCRPWCAISDALPHVISSPCRHVSCPLQVRQCPAGRVCRPVRAPLPLLGDGRRQSAPHVRAAAAAEPRRIDGRLRAHLPPPPNPPPRPHRTQRRRRRLRRRPRGSSRPTVARQTDGATDVTRAAIIILLYWNVY